MLAKIVCYRSLSSKFILMAILLSLLPLFIIYQYSVNSATEMLANSLKDNLKEKPFLVGADIDRYFQQRVHDVGMISQADVLESDNAA